MVVGGGGVMLINGVVRDCVYKDNGELVLWEVCEKLGLIFLCYGDFVNFVLVGCGIGNSVEGEFKFILKFCDGVCCVLIIVLGVMCIMEVCDGEGRLSGIIFFLKIKIILVVFDWLLEEEFDVFLL